MPQMPLTFKNKWLHHPAGPVEMTSARIKPIITCPDLSSGSEVPPESSERNTPLELDSAEQPSHQNLFTRIEDEEDDEIQFRREVYSLDIPDYLVPGAPEHNNTEATGKKRKNNNTKKTEKCGVMPAEIAVEPELAKYWAQRYRLFSWFDEGIKLEQVSQVLFRVHLPTCQFLLPGSCARFGSSLHWFAGTFQYNSPMLAIDIDPVRLALAQHNAQVYEVAEHIDVVQGDFLKLAPRLSGDVVFRLLQRRRLRYQEHDGSRWF
ncbi:trimethylguanosine synthase-like isoform X2 [Oncorhynchus keta]|uniref:trimethylguanosine synthase-like isoform X2 n=1 Tax=Oncorhynchus keta TaxID=8018 RepID=UPI00227B41DB|nr:trimethylguanosine synthase-like isoform X2 [Oncorhynchus keta]